MTTANPWFYGLLGVIVIIVIAWPAILIFHSRRPRPGGRGDTSKDRWSGGGMFRGDPRAASRRDEMPSPADLPSPGELGPGDALPPEPGEMAQRHQADAGDGARPHDGHGYP